MSELSTAEHAVSRSLRRIWRFAYERARATKQVRESIEAANRAISQPVEGDRVRRVLDVGRGEQLADMEGTVLQVLPRGSKGAGGVRARVRVEWENGHVGLLDDRQVQVV